MNNIELARLLAYCMYQLACMVIWCQQGNRARADKCESEFRKTFESLDALEAGIKEEE